MADTLLRPQDSHAVEVVGCASPRPCWVRGDSSVVEVVLRKPRCQVLAVALAEGAAIAQKVA